jgi:hypothetical protein
MKGVVELAAKFVPIDVKFWNDKRKRKDNVQADKRWKTFEAFEEIHPPLACYVVRPNLCELGAVVAEGRREYVIHVAVPKETRPEVKSDWWGEVRCTSLYAPFAFL